MQRSLTRCLAALATLVSCAFAPAALAFQLAAGPAVAESGDDRLEPAAAVRMGIGAWEVDATYFGRQYGPVTSQTLLVAFVREWDLFKSKSLTAHFGPVVMDEREALQYEQAQYKAYDEKKDSYNAGADFGVRWGLPEGSAPLALALSWDSAVFAAGGQGAFFLVSARKQTLSLTAGIGF